MNFLLFNEKIPILNNPLQIVSRWEGYNEIILLQVNILVPRTLARDACLKLYNQLLYAQTAPIQCDLGCSIVISRFDRRMWNMKETIAVQSMTDPLNNILRQFL